MAHVFASKHQDYMKEAMALLKARATQEYKNASPMDSARNAFMIRSALVSAISAPVMFVFVANHLNHVIQPLAMHVKKEPACAVKTLSAHQNVRVW